MRVGPDGKLQRRQVLMEGEAPADETKDAEPRRSPRRPFRRHAARARRAPGPAHARRDQRDDLPPRAARPAARGRGRRRSRRPGCPSRDEDRAAAEPPTVPRPSGPRAAREGVTRGATLGSGGAERGRMAQQIQIGFQTFVSDGGEEFGAVRQVSSGTSSSTSRTRATSASRSTRSSPSTSARSSSRATSSTGSSARRSGTRTTPRSPASSRPRLYKRAPVLVRRRAGCARAAACVLLFQRSYRAREVALDTTGGGARRVPRRARTARARALRGCTLCTIGGG